MHEHAQYRRLGEQAGPAGRRGAGGATTRAAVCVRPRTMRHVPAVGAALLKPPNPPPAFAGSPAPKAAPPPAAALALKPPKPPPLAVAILAAAPLALKPPKPPPLAVAVVAAAALALKPPNPPPLAAAGAHEVLPNTGVVVVPPGDVTCAGLAFFCAGSLVSFAASDCVGRGHCIALVTCARTARTLLCLHRPAPR